MRAAYEGSQEVAFTILSMTLALVAVFIPVLFMGGVVGRLLHEFSVTISVAILVSGFVSISLTPMLCSRFLKPQHAQQHGRFYNATERMFDAWLRLYDRTLRATLRFRAATMVVSFLLLVATVYLFTVVPKGFLPSEDQGRFSLSTEGAQGLGFQEMVSHQQQVADIVAQDPNVFAFTSQIGFGGGSNGSNQGSMFIELKPLSERKLSVDQVMEELRPKVAQVPGIRSFLVNQPPINIGAPGTRSLYQFTLQDTDTDELYRWAPIMEDKMKDDLRDSRTSTATCRSRTRRSPSTWTAIGFRRSA